MGSNSGVKPIWQLHFTRLGGSGTQQQDTLDNSDLERGLVCKLLLQVEGNEGLVEKRE